MPLPNAQQNCKKCKRNDDYDNMVQCEAEDCEKWFHFSCVGFTNEQQDNAWYCEQCKNVITVANKPAKPTAHEHQIGSVMQSTSPPRVVLEVGTPQQSTAITSMHVQLQQAQDQLSVAHVSPVKSNVRKIRGQASASSQLCVPELPISERNRDPSKSLKSKSASSDMSYVSKSQASTKNGKLQLQLQRLEEERQLRELREKDYIQKKYELYDKHNSDSELESDGELVDQELNEQQRVGQERVKNWVHNSVKRDDKLNSTWVGGIPSAMQKISHPQQQPQVNTRGQQQQGEGTILNKHQIAARQIMSKEQVNFYGNPEEWPLFISWWENSTRSCGYTSQENLLRLQRCIKGDAMKKLKYKLVMPDQVERAIETLRMLYGRPEIIIDTLLEQIRSEPPLKPDKLETLIDFSLSVENICITMLASGLHSHLNNSYLLKELIDRLPTQIKLSWGVHKQTLSIIDLQAFSNWLAQVAQAAAEVTTTTFVAKEHKSIRKSKAFINVHQSREEQLNDPNKFRKCCVCDEKCKTVNLCQRFINMSLADKWSTLKRNFLCRTCLKQHGRRTCASSDVCGVNGCTFRHHRLLHDVNKQIRREQTDSDSRKQPNDYEKKSNEEAVQFSGTTHRKGQSSTLFKIIPVTLYYDSSQIDTYAFLDDGSSVTLIEEELAQALEADGKNEPLCLKWTANTRRMEETSKKIDFEVSALGAQQRFSLPDVHTVKSLELPKQSVNARRLLTEYRHLRVVPLKSYENVKPRLLIGLQHCNLGVPMKTIEGNVNEPVAMKTRLGWTVFGTDPSRISMTPNENSFNFHICECQKIIDDDMHRMMKEYFAIERFVSKKGIKLLSNDDAKAVQLLEQKTIFDGTRYTVPLLWKHDTSMLPSSWKMAERRLNCLEKKISREPELFSKMDNQIKEYIEKGYARKLSRTETEKTPAWYLPIFPVVNPNKPNKVRIVWDAAAKVNGVSLNSFLLTGPDEVPSLTGVLYRFREGKYAIFGDIREMFHQIKVLKEDQNFLRFLWRNTVTNEIEVFTMLVLIFGSTSSPFCAQFIKNKNAHRFAERFPRAYKAITENHFVDDFLDSVDDEDEAIVLARDVIFVHQQGGFEIRNFMSNSEKVLKALDGKATTINKSGQDLKFADSAEKLLGMWWSPVKDSFLFTFKAKKMNQEVMLGKVIPTKRQVLTALMCVFDPLGLIANFVIILKILLQDVWRSGVGWDDNIKEAHCERWKTWLSIIPDIKHITVPRYYLSDFKKSRVQLHVFVDASETAYAAVAYFRISSALSANCALISARTRVGPIKPMSIPRMELEAAVLGTRLAKSIVEDHSVDIKDIFYWTDSKIVLCWIKSEHRKYKSFVAYRIGEILENSEEKDWKWVPSKENVADDATKYKSSYKFHSQSRWYQGPSFLKSSEDDWPKESPESCNEPEEDHEVKECYMHTAVESTCVIQYRRFSNWNRLLRATMFALRFLDIVTKLRKKSEDHAFTVNERRRAENYLYRQCQIESFKKEYDTLKQGGRQLNRSSSLYKLSPYVDEHGVMRIKGRIDATPYIPHHAKRPIILPKDHYITTLILLEFHKNFHHIYNESVVNEIRQFFYIECLRAALKNMRRGACQKCKNQRASPKPPIMSELPPARLQPFTRPFSYIGIDYFGPLYVKVGRHAEKRWGMLITCLTVRAIHIEIAHSLSSDSCILGLKRFIARRGMPLEIYSDNGTNFRGASSELKEAMSHLNEKDLAKAFDMKLKWNFIPPLSPHMGGSWERLVRTVKQTLIAMNPTRNPNDELLLSMMAEVEFVVNSRPLTYVPINSENDEALTPNSFLMGSSSGRKLSGHFDDSAHVLRRNWLISERYADLFWRRWVREYLPDLTRRTKWFRYSESIKEGDVVVLCDTNNPRCEWPKGIIIKVLPGADGEVRSAVVKTATGVYTRPVVKLAVLEVQKFPENGNQDLGTSLPGGSVAKLGSTF